jgi:hypothetical protein
MYGTGLLLGLIVYGFLIWLIAYTAHKITKKEIVRKYIYILSVIIPVLIVLINFLPAYLKLQSLCHKNAGKHIYKEIKANGYLDVRKDANCTNCYIDLITGEYKYFEFHVTNASKYSSKLIDENGFYRVYQTTRPSHLCERVDKAVQKKHKYYEEFFKDNCIAIEKVNEPISQYSFDSGVYDIEGFLLEKGDIRAFYSNIKDRFSGEIIAESRSYTYTLFKNTFPSETLYCSIKSSERKRTGTIREILFSTKNKEVE